MKKAIYKITNLINGKIYVGQSKDPVRRWKEHKWDAFNSNCKENSAIHKAFSKYGLENFEFTIIGLFENYNEKEKYYIKELDTLFPNGYNLTGNIKLCKQKYYGYNVTKNENGKYDFSNVLDLAMNKMPSKYYDIRGIINY